MFDLLDRPLVWIVVKWPGLRQGDDAATAEVVTHEVELQVEIIDRDEFGRWIEKVDRDGEDKHRSNPAAELSIFRDVVKGWRRIRAQGRAVEFTDENIGALLRFPGFVTAFGAAYMNAWRGQVETRTGNSESSPASGPAGAA